MSKDAVFVILQKAQQYKDEILQKKAIEYIAANFATLLEDIQNTQLHISNLILIFNHASFALDTSNDTIMSKFSALLQHIIDKHKLLQNEELTAQFLQVLQSQNLLAIDLAVTFVKHFEQVNSATAMNTIKSCVPVIAQHFYKLKSSNMDWTTLSPELVAEILGSDDLIVKSEDEVYNLVMTYFAKNATTCSDKDKKNIVERIRFVNLSMYNCCSNCSRYKSIEQHYYRIQKQNITLVWLSKRIGRIINGEDETHREQCGF